MERGASERLEAGAVSDWEALYQAGDTRWEKGAPHPELIAILRKLPLHGRVLVPGCGFGHDARAIAATADEVVGIDIAPSAIAGAKQHPAVGGERYAVADLFALPAAMRGAFDWVFEHTCFCAISPERREDYVAAITRALVPGGRVLAIFYMTPDMDPGEEGPPFGSTKAELDERFGDAFRVLAEWVPAATHPGREGRELCRVMELSPR